MKDDEITVTAEGYRATRFVFIHTSEHGACINSFEEFEMFVKKLNEAGLQTFGVRAQINLGTK